MNKDIKLLQKLFSLRQHPLKNVLREYLKENYDKIIETESYLCAIGDIPIGLVAHLDTVFQDPPKTIYYNKKNNVLRGKKGLGADDRAGVFAILKVIEVGYRPTVIFTTDEEIGCLGASALVRDFEIPFTALNFIIELDRRGTNDCVFYECDNKDFSEYIESFGFVINIGSFSDISVICPSWGIAGVNLSVGYYNEHTHKEYLNLNELYITIDKVINILTQDEIPVFDYIPSPYSVGWWMHNFNSETFCYHCFREYNEHELIAIKDEKGETNYLCVDCFIKYTESNKSLSDFLETDF